MAQTIDSFRYLDFFTKKMLKTWIANEHPVGMPWTKLDKPLAECTVAMVSSAGLAMRDDTPFDQQGERDNPWWGDPTFRVIRHDATEQDVRCYHLHIDPRFAEQDINAVLPLTRLTELAQEGEVGASAPSHYSIMGYLPRVKAMIEQSVPSMVEQMKSEQVDLVLLVPV